MQCGTHRNSLSADGPAAIRRSEATQRKRASDWIRRMISKNNSKKRGIFLIVKSQRNMSKRRIHFVLRNALSTVPCTRIQGVSEIAVQSEKSNSFRRGFVFKKIDFDNSCLKISRTDL